MLEIDSPTRHTFSTCTVWDHFLASGGLQKINVLPRIEPSVRITDLNSDAALNSFARVAMSICTRLRASAEQEEQLHT
jgi:hypothetical protein